ncbi:hypothetical protein DW194_20005, partial [Subdoligranulum sp. AM16-9]
AKCEISVVFCSSRIGLITGMFTAPLYIYCITILLRGQFLILHIRYICFDVSQNRLISLCTGNFLIF